MRRYLQHNTIGVRVDAVTQVVGGSLLAVLTGVRHVQVYAAEFRRIISWLQHSLAV
jgi:hypothetical protein